MTVRYELIARLEKMGMFHAQAEAVIKLAEPKLNEVFKDNPIELDGGGSFGSGVYNVLMSYVKPIALEWIEENKPRAWYKEMFK